MPDRTLSIDGVRVPRFLYGTAWKEDETQRLTELALRQGFRGIDTANQRRHYHEAAVGQAIAASVASGLVARDDLFLQTKFTFRRGQDHRLPYDPDAPIAIQVEQSFASSLEHLGTEVIDSYLLHGPTPAGRPGRGRLGGLAGDGSHPRQRPGSPARRQQRHPRTAPAPVPGGARPAPLRPEPLLRRPGLGSRVREFCAANGMVYQGFSLLTANREALARPELARIAKRHGRTVSQIVFRFALDVGMMPLTGTTDADHMRADLESSISVWSPKKSSGSRGWPRRDASCQFLGVGIDHFFIHWLHRCFGQCH